MHVPARLSVVLVTGLAIGLLGGCAAAPAANVGRPAEPMAGFAYEPSPAPTPLNASASIEVSVSFDPEMRAVWLSTVGNNYRVDSAANGILEAIRSDLTHSRLFTTVVAPGQPSGTYRVVVTCEQATPANVTLRMKASLLDATGRELFSRQAEVPIGLKVQQIGRNRYSYTMTGTPPFPGDVGPNQYSIMAMMTGFTRTTLAQVMPLLKAGIADAVRRIEFQPALAKLQTATLPELLASSDPFPDFARARNHALLAAKTTQLAGLLRNSRSEELTALVVKIEQTILDLEHEGVLLKDRAQHAVGAGSGNVEEQRGLSLSYRERVEILKPILGQLKDEIVNRSR